MLITVPYTSSHFNLVCIAALWHHSGPHYISIIYYSSTQNTSGEQILITMLSWSIGLVFSHPARFVIYAPITHHKIIQCDHAFIIHLSLHHSSSHRPPRYLKVEMTAVRNLFCRIWAGVAALEDLRLHNVFSNVTEALKWTSSIGFEIYSWCLINSSRLNEAELSSCREK